MTRDELREKIAKSICNDWGYLWDGDPDDMQVISENDEPYDDRPSRKIFRLAADGVLDTIFAALKDTTTEMDKAAYESEGVGYFGENYTLIEPEYVWQAMLSASALAPSKER